MQRAKVVKRGRYGNTRYPKALKSNGYGATILEDAVPQRVAGFRTYVKKADITENSSVHLSKHKEENKRKQAPLCKSHHYSLHKNKLTEAEKIAFTEWCSVN
jgi:hypothetical protein